MAVLACGAACGRVGYTPVVEPYPRDAATGPADGAGAAEASRDATPDEAVKPNPRDAAIGPADGAGAAEASRDGTPDEADVTGSRPLPSCPAARAWSTGFDSDPRAADVDGDAVLDWVDNRGRLKKADLVGGTWRPGDGSILDTRPLWPFATRTLLFVRFQSLSVTAPNASTSWGALAWLNVNNSMPQNTAVYLSLKHEPGGGQTLHLAANGRTPADITAITGLPERLIDAALDVDPVSHTARLWVDSVYQGEWTVPSSGGSPADAFATVASFSGDSVFDSVNIVSCQP